MTVGGLMFWGLTRDLEHRWDKCLDEDGYGSEAEVAGSLDELSAFPGLLASWKAREAQRLESLKAKTPDADEAALEKELEALREDANDGEPQGIWNRSCRFRTDCGRASWGSRRAAA